MRDEFANALVVLIAAQQLRFGQRHQMLVTVQFPNDLVVADRREIEKRDFAPGIERSALAMHGVEMPVDFTAEVEILITEQAKTMGADLIGVAQNGGHFFGQMLAQQFGAG